MGVYHTWHATVSRQVNRYAAVCDSGLPTTPLHVCHSICTTELSPSAFVGWFGVAMTPRVCRNQRTDVIAPSLLPTRWFSCRGTSGMFTDNHPVFMTSTIIQSLRAFRRAKLIFDAGSWKIIIIISVWSFIPVWSFFPV